MPGPQYFIWFYFSSCSDGEKIGKSPFHLQQQVLPLPTWISSFLFLSGISLFFQNRDTKINQTCGCEFTQKEVSWKWHLELFAFLTLIFIIILLLLWTTECETLSSPTHFPFHFPLCVIYAKSRVRLFGPEWVGRALEALEHPKMLVSLTWKVICQQICNH